MFEFSERLIVPQHVLVRHLDGETVLLNLDTEKYFGLDATATRMWQLATNSPNIETAYASLVEEFDVDPEILRANLADLLGQLLGHGLLKVARTDVESISAV